MRSPMPEPQEPMERGAERSRESYRAERPAFQVIPRHVREAEEALDVVRWGPIIAGTVTTMSIMVVMTVLGLLIGFAQIGTAGAITVTDPNLWAIWGALSMIVALFFGGWLAARTSGFAGPFSGIVDGSLVWATALITTLVLAGLGATAAFGPLGGLFGVPGTAAPAVADPTMLALWSFVGLIVGYAVAVAGGLWGAQQEKLSPRR